jgi:hypothetical protein
MITIESSTSIARRPDEVFAFVSDVRNDPRWHTDVLEARLTEEGSIGHGSTFAMRIKPFLGQSEGTATVSESSHRAAWCSKVGWASWRPPSS